MDEFVQNLRSKDNMERIIGEYIERRFEHYDLSTLHEDTKQMLRDVMAEESFDHLQQYYEDKISTREGDFMFLKENMLLFYEKIEYSLQLFSGKYKEAEYFYYSEVHHSIIKVLNTWHTQDKTPLINHVSLYEAITYYIYPLYKEQLYEIADEYIERRCAEIK